MRDKLEKIVEAYAELEQKLADPAVVSDPKEYARVAKEHSNQADLVAHANKYISGTSATASPRQQHCNAAATAPARQR